MNYGRIYSWNPLRQNMICFSPEGESGGGGGSSSASSGGSSAPAGGSSAPSGTPSDGGSSSGSSGAPTGAEADASPSLASDPFEGFGDDDFLDLGDSPTGDDPGEGTQEEPVVPAPAGEVPPATPPAAKPPVEAAPPSQSPSAPRTARDEMQQAVNDFKGNFNELSNWAAQELFSLSPEESDALDTDVRSAIPKLMGRVYTQAIMAATNIALNFTPRMISEGFASQSAATARSNEAKNAFYKEYPELNEATHGAAFNQWAKMFRQMNPKASRADAIKFVGNALLTQFGIQRAVKAPPQGGVPRTPPFQPARPGGRQPTSSQVVDDPYAGLDQDFMDSGD